MTKLFEFDEDATLDAMAYSSSIDLMYGQVTLFAVTCIGAARGKHFSHGGMLTLDANEAIATAKHQNELAYHEGATCRYLPSAVGIDPGSLVHIAALVTGQAELGEPGDV